MSVSINISLSVVCVSSNSYEDTVGGVQADVVLFFRPSVAAGTTAPAPAPAAGEGAGAFRGDVSEAGGGRDGGAGGEQGESALLTVIVRPLPSTAPASVDSGSSRGGVRKRRARVF